MNQVTFCPFFFCKCSNSWRKLYWVMSQRYSINMKGWSPWKTLDRSIMNMLFCCCACWTNLVQTSAFKNVKPDKQPFWLVCFFSVCAFFFCLCESLIFELCVCVFLLALTSCVECMFNEDSEHITIFNISVKKESLHAFFCFLFFCFCFCFLFFVVQNRGRLEQMQQCMRDTWTQITSK